LGGNSEICGDSKSDKKNIQWRKEGEIPWEKVLTLRKNQDTLLLNFKNLIIRIDVSNKISRNEISHFLRCFFVCLRAAA